MISYRATLWGCYLNSPPPWVWFSISRNKKVTAYCAGQTGLSLTKLLLQLPLLFTVVLAALLYFLDHLLQVLMTIPYFYVLFIIFVCVNFGCVLLYWPSVPKGIETLPTGNNCLVYFGWIFFGIFLIIFWTAWVHICCNMGWGISPPPLTCYRVKSNPSLLFHIQFSRNHGSTVVGPILSTILSVGLELPNKEKDSLSIILWMGLRGVSTGSVELVEWTSESNQKNVFW